MLVRRFYMCSTAIKYLFSKLTVSAYTTVLCGLHSMLELVTS